jgi:hypothetical protein
MLFLINFSLIMTSILLFIWGIAGLDGQGRKEAELCMKISPVFCVIALIITIIFKYII